MKRLAHQGWSRIVALISVVATLSSCRDLPQWTPDSLAIDAAFAITITAPLDGEKVVHGSVIYATVKSTFAIQSFVLKAPAGVTNSSMSNNVFSGKLNGANLQSGPLTLTFEAVNARQETLTVSRTVEFVKFSGKPVSGTVTFGSPVSGSQVTAYGFDGLKQGDSLGTAVTDNEGRFEIDIAGDAPSPNILIRAELSEAAAVDPTTGTKTSFAAGHSLTTVVNYNAQTGLSEVPVHGLTTLMTTLAQAYETSGAPLEDALSDADTNLSMHLIRGKLNAGTTLNESYPNGFPIRLTGEADLTGMFDGTWPSAEVAVALFHAGLWQLAQTVSNRPGEDVSAAGLLTMLSLDLADGLFDGKDAAGAGLSVTTSTTREDLAGAVDTFVSEAPELLFSSGQPVAELALLLSMDDGPLYPPDKATEPYDLWPPTVSIVPPTPDEGTYVGTLFSVFAEASDVGGIAVFDMLFIPGAVITQRDEHDPDGGYLAVDVDAGTLADGDTLIKVHVVDFGSNEVEVERVLILDQTPPKITFNEPVTVSNTPAHTIKGTVLDSGCGLSKAHATLDDVEIVFQVEPDGSFSASLNLQEGEHTFAVVAEDKLGNAATVPHTITIDMTPPTVLLQPTVFYDELASVMIYDEVTGDVSFKPKVDANTAVTIGGAASACTPVDGLANSATVYACNMPLHKYVTQMVHALGKSPTYAAASDQNFPVFRFLAYNSDPGEAPSQVSLAYWFAIDGAGVTSKKTMPLIDGEPMVPLALPYLSDSYQEGQPFDWLASSVPNQLIVIATDLAGNEKKTTWTFDLVLKMPPLVVQDVPNWKSKDWDVTAYSLGVQLSDPGSLFSNNPQASVKSHGGARVARFKVLNPYNVTGAFALHSAQKLTVSQQFKHAFLLDPNATDKDCTLSDCNTNQCAYESAVSGLELPSCQKDLYQLPGPDTITLDVAVGLEALSESDIDADNPPVTVLGQESQTVQLEPGQAVVINVVAQTVGTGWIAPATAYTFLNTQLTTQLTKYFNVVNAQDLDPDATVKYGYDDKAFCTEVVVPAANLCKVRTYLNPMIVSKLTFASGLSGGNVVPATVKMTRKVPGLKESDAASDESVLFMHSTQHFYAYLFPYTLF